MSDAPHLLIIWHSRTGGSKALARAAADGAATARLVAASDVMPDDLHAAAACLFVGPENLAALSGAMKEMFDRCYYPCLGKLEGRPYATIIWRWARTAKMPNASSTGSPSAGGCAASPIR